MVGVSGAETEFESPLGPLEDEFDRIRRCAEDDPVGDGPTKFSSDAGETRDGDAPAGRVGVGGVTVVTGVMARPGGVAGIMPIFPVSRTGPVIPEV